MSSSAYRRTKRKFERDRRLGKLGRYVEPVESKVINSWGERELDLPTPNDVEEYILDKTRELRMEYKPIKIEKNGLQL